MKSLKLPVRFSDKITIKNVEDCWEWRGRKNKGGYGEYDISSRKKELSHRFIYFLLNPTANKLLCVLHYCDNPPCCSPNHLFLGTRQDNIKDMVNKNRHAIS